MAVGEAGSEDEAIEMLRMHLNFMDGRIRSLATNAESSIQKMEDMVKTMRKGSTLTSPDGNASYLSNTGSTAAWADIKVADDLLDAELAELQTYKLANGSSGTGSGRGRV